MYHKSRILSKFQDHFTGVSKMVSIGSGAQRPQDDYNLSRFPCYLLHPSENSLRSGAGQRKSDD